MCDRLLREHAYSVHDLSATLKLHPQRGGGRLSCGHKTYGTNLGSCHWLIKVGSCIQHYVWPYIITNIEPLIGILLNNHGASIVFLLVLQNVWVKVNSSGRVFSSCSVIAPLHEIFQQADWQRVVDFLRKLLEYLTMWLQCSALRTTSRHTPCFTAQFLCLTFIHLLHTNFYLICWIWWTCIWRKLQLFKVLMVLSVSCT